MWGINVDTLSDFHTCKCYQKYRLQFTHSVNDIVNKEHMVMSVVSKAEILGPIDEITSKMMSK